MRWATCAPAASPVPLSCFPDPCAGEIGVTGQCVVPDELGSPAHWIVQAVSIEHATAPAPAARDPFFKATIMTLARVHRDEEADVVVGYGFAGATAAMTARDSGAKVLLLEKAPGAHKGGNSRVFANIVFWPDDVAKAKSYFRAMAGPYMDHVPEEMLDVWATEMFANKSWLEGRGMVPVEIPYVEFPDFAGSECVRVLLNGEGPIGGERLWHLIEASVDARHIDTGYETAVMHLVEEDRDVIGVMAEREGGRIAIRARCGVVLTCGGFENNPAMIRNYVNGLPRVFPVGTPYNRLARSVA